MSTITGLQKNPPSSSPHFLEDTESLSIEHELLNQQLVSDSKRALSCNVLSGSMDASICRASAIFRMIPANRLPSRRLIADLPSTFRNARAASPTLYSSLPAKAADWPKNSRIFFLTPSLAICSEELFPLAPNSS